MDTAEPLSKKRRVSWIDERMRKPLHEVKYIAKENIGKKAAEAKGQKISKEILLATNSTKNRMRKFVYSCPPRKLQMKCSDFENANFGNTPLRQKLLC